MRTSPADPFDSPLETGLRALVVLEAMYPRACDLSEMTWYDHLVVNTADIADRDGGEGPRSLHPATPGRHDALNIRRQAVEASLMLMHRVHLVEVRHCEDGIRYASGETTPSFLDALQAPYMLRLKDRARWLASRFEGMDAADIAAVVDRHVGLWAVQFRSGEGDRP
ncbi:ABC-three component system middle component 2 [Methylobacterium pseudosasicola]|nr:ABC-three component system middle component 2 [Methylobacterium pseudosasicola]